MYLYLFLEDLYFYLIKLTHIATFNKIVYHIHVRL